MQAKKSTSAVKSLNHFFLLAFSVGLLCLLGLLLFSQHKKELPVLGEPGHRVGEFEFLDQDGHIFSEKDVRGRIRISEFFFTTCKSICPIMNGNLQEVQSAFKDRNDVIILSHTVDPQKDDTARLRQYAKQVEAIAGKWEFLTGSKKALYKMAKQDYLLGVDSAADENLETAFIHTQYISLVDKEDRIRGFYDATDKKEIKKLIADINNLY